MESDFAKRLSSNNPTYRSPIRAAIITAALRGETDVVMPRPPKLQRIVQWLQAEGYTTSYSDDFLIIQWRN